MRIQSNMCKHLEQSLDNNKGSINVSIFPFLLFNIGKKGDLSELQHANIIKNTWYMNVP